MHVHVDQPRHQIATTPIDATCTGQIGTGHQRGRSDDREPTLLDDDGHLSMNRSTATVDEIDALEGDLANRGGSADRRQQERQSDSSTK